MINSATNITIPSILKIVSAGYSKNNQIDEEFAAIQTALTKVASRFGRLENSICQQNSKQTEIFVHSITDMSTAIVGALGSFQRSFGGQPQSWQPPHPQAAF